MNTLSLFVSLCSLFCFIKIHPVSATIRCDDYLECSDVVSSSNVVNELQCRGFMSCASAHINATVEKLRVYGALSALTSTATDYSMSIISASGFYGIANADIVLGTSPPNVDAESTFGIINTNFSSTEAHAGESHKVYVQGYASLIGSRVDLSAAMFSDIYIGIEAYFAMYQSEIIVRSETCLVELKARMATYDSTIYVVNNTVCDVECVSPYSCYGLNLICDESSTCNVNCNESMGYFCPNQFSDNLIEYQPFSLDTEYNPEKTMSGLFSGILSSAENVLAHMESNPSDLLTEDYLSYFDDACFYSCADYDSCTDSWEQDFTIEYYFNLTNTSTVPPSDKGLCLLSQDAADRSSTVINIPDHDVFALGYTAAEDANIWARNIYAIGSWSLPYSQYLESPRGSIYCLGLWGCAGVYEMWRAMHLYCLSVTSCEDAEIYDIPNIYLLAHEACDGCEIYTTNQTKSIDIYKETYSSSFGVHCHFPHDVCTVYCFDPGLACQTGVTFDCANNATCIFKYYNGTLTVPSQAPSAFPSAFPSALPTSIPTDQPVVVEFSTTSVLAEGSGKGNSEKNSSELTTRETIFLVIGAVCMCCCLVVTVCAIVIGKKMLFYKAIHKKKENASMVDLGAVKQTGESDAHDDNPLNDDTGKEKTGVASGVIRESSFDDMYDSHAETPVGADAYETAPNLGEKSLP